MTNFYIKINLFQKIFNSIWSEATFWEENKKQKVFKIFITYYLIIIKPGNIFNVDHILSPIQKVVILTIFDIMLCNAIYTECTKFLKENNLVHLRHYSN